MSEDRRTFLKTVGGVSAVLAGAAAQAQEVREELAIDPEAAAARSFVGGRFALELEDQNVGFLPSAEGGTATADVVAEKGSPGFYQKKHLAGIKYEDVVVNAGTGLSPAFYQWIQSAIDLDGQRKDGALVVADFDYKVRQRREFFRALITEVSFPALDAASKDAARLTVKIKPEITRLKSGEGKLLPAVNKQKKWLVSNFRLNLGDLPVNKVNKIDAFTFKQKTTEFRVGEGRDYEILPGDPEVSNLAFTLPESQAKPLYDWFEDFVIKGNNADDKEKTGSLEYLAPDLKTVLFRIDFTGVGIFALSPEKVEAGSENIRRVKAEVYVEQIHFSYFV